MTTYHKVTCACGREIGENNFRRHGRKCAAQLRAWARNGNAVFLLDERTEDQKKAEPIK